MALQNNEEGYFVESFNEREDNEVVQPTPGVVFSTPDEECVIANCQSEVVSVEMARCLGIVRKAFLDCGSDAMAKHLSRELQNFLKSNEK